MTDYHLYRIKNAIDIINESLDALFSNLEPKIKKRTKQVQDFYNISELPAVVGFGKSTIYVKMSEGTFPQSIKLTAGKTVWRKVDIHKWLDGIRSAVRRERY